MITPELTKKAEEAKQHLIEEVAKMLKMDVFDATILVKAISGFAVLETSEMISMAMEAKKNKEN